MLKLDCCFSHP